VKPSEVQLDLATGIRARAEGETTGDSGAQVLGRLREKCREPGDAERVTTIRPTCALPLDVMQDCRKRRIPFPDPHRWEEQTGALRGWLRCTRCKEWTRQEALP
jgi:hypothetical protein